jgi:hypothetical protein
LRIQFSLGHLSRRRKTRTEVKLGTIDIGSHELQKLSAWKISLSVKRPLLLDSNVFQLYLFRTIYIAVTFFCEPLTSNSRYHAFAPYTAALDGYEESVRDTSSNKTK